MQAITALLGALLTLAACYALGTAMAKRLALSLGKLEIFPLAMTLGASVLHLAIFAIFVLQIAYLPVFVAVLLAALALGFAAGGWRIEDISANESAMPAGIRYGLVAVALVYFIVYWTNAWAPEFSPDGSTYHLGILGRYLRAHGFEPVPTNVYASLSQGFEMLFAPAFSIGKHSAAALVHFGFLITLGIAVFAYGRRIGKPIAGACAALFVCLSPIVGVDGSSAYVDVAAATAAFCTFYFTELWDEKRSTGLLIAMGLVGGYCYAIKYTMAILLFYAVVFVLWKSRSLRSAFMVAATASVMILPWIAKDWTFVGNPIAPFGNTIFRNPYIHPEFERYWSEYLRHYDLKSLWQIPLEVTIHGELLGGALGPVFLGAPLALLGMATKQGRRLIVPAILLSAIYFGNVGTRFLIPLLPFVALGMALALERFSIYAAPVVVLGHALASWPPYFHQYSNAWAIVHVPHKAALRLQSEEEFLGWRQDYQIARMIENTVPEGGRVYTTNGLPDAYTTREILVGYEGAENALAEDILGIAGFEIYSPSRAWVSHFSPRKVSAIRIVQTAAMPKPEEQWNIHEVHVYSKGREVPRDPRWRLSAFPNPWDVGMAFDHSLATRWRTWETTKPGDFLQLDFGAEQTIDELRLITSPDNEDVQLRLETKDAQGHWLPLDVKDAAFEKRHMAPEDDVKRAATYELRQRGIDYILVRDTDWGGTLFSSDPASWGLAVASRVGPKGSGATLYQINPYPKTPYRKDAETP
ncbi:MAG: glycosyltransferase family 39 protein [Bryobacteraceae bacterium]